MMSKLNFVAWTYKNHVSYILSAANYLLFLCTCEWLSALDMLLLLLMSAATLVLPTSAL